MPGLTRVSATSSTSARRGWPIALVLALALFTMPTLTFKVCAWGRGVVTAERIAPFDDSGKLLPVALMGSISRISVASAQANSASITTPTAGDLILVFAHRDGSNTAPSLATGYINIANAGANTNSARIGYKYSTGAETTTGTWTNATSVSCIVYRGIDRNAPIGAFVANGGTGTSVTFSALTPQLVNSTSWIAGFAGHRTATNVNQAPSGMTLQTSATDVGGSDTNAVANAFSSASITVNASSGWRTYVVEIRAKQSVTLSPDPLVWTAAAQGQGQAGNAFVIYAVHPTLSGNLLVLELQHSTGVSVSSVADDKSGGSSTYTAHGAPATNGGGNHDLRLYWTANCAAGITKVTVTFSGNVNECKWRFSQFTGVVASSPVDGTSTGSNSQTSAGLVKSGSITTTQAGDLIYHCAVDCQQAFLFNNTAVEGIAADANFKLLGAHRIDGGAAQYSVQAAGGAINPGLWFMQSGNPDTYNSLTIAFKMDGSGTAPTGMRVVHLFTEQSRDTATYTHQFPSDGNLICGVTSNSSIQIDWTACVDNNANSYTQVQLDTTSPQHWYAQNATTSNDLNITMTADAVGLIQRYYDITGAATSGSPTTAWANGTQGAAGASLSNAPPITPGFASGLTVASVAFGTGPGLSVTSPTGAVFDNSPYTSEDDGGQMNWGDMWGHYVFATSAAQNWSWTDATPVASGWIAQAVAFPAPASGRTTKNARAFPLGTELGMNIRGAA